MPDNLATLLSGLGLLLEFGREQAILSDQKIQHCKTTATNAAQKLANLQVIVDKEASEAERVNEHKVDMESIQQEHVRAAEAIDLAQAAVAAARAEL